MPILGKFESASGKIVDEGWHDMEIVNAKMFKYNTGSPGIEFELQGDGGGITASFCLVETILWQLADFCKACGLTSEQLAKYDTDSMNSHRRMVGRKVRVLVVKKKKAGRERPIKEVEEWESVDSPPPKPFIRPEPPAQEPESQQECPF